MHMTHSNNLTTNQGFIKLIIIVIVAVIILGYYGLDVRKVVEGPTVQKNLAYVGHVASDIWNGYLKAAVVFIWEVIRHK